MKKKTDWKPDPKTGLATLRTEVGPWVIMTVEYRPIREPDEAQVHYLYSYGTWMWSIETGPAGERTWTFYKNTAFEQHCHMCEVAVRRFNFDTLQGKELLDG